MYMAMPDTLAGWTVPELDLLPDDGNTYELVRGQLFVTPAPSAPHQEIVGVLAELLHPYVAKHRLGRLHFPRSVIRIGTYSQVEPDLMVRPVTSRPPASWEEAPLPILVVEVTSATTKRRDRIEKRAFYRDEGVPDYWIVDRDRRTISVVRQGQDDAELATEVTWHPVGASEGLTIAIGQLFRAALGD